ncbi:T-cell-specific surface glycoprotein CD28 [Collichthys lucidus]|uniref:T-cell-specific surface glycoprotein CD28 n=1 Tax=Collichthys lucidus TaxID=240159 RepID=A0A4U5TXE7_COLLU|nr:T-cell-specific surface glycoprotein CD28 [Collichthys lucidus]
MSACWVFVFLVGCRLSHATPSPTSECSDQLRKVCVPVGGNVTVPCPVSDNSESSFNLFHADERIYNHTCSHCHAGVELHTENKSASFKLIGVNSSSFGIYRCEGTVMYPPPLIKRNKRTLVLIEGQQCNKVCRTTKVEPNCGYHWIWILTLVSTYSITITIVAISIWIKLRRTDSQSDYMNTKPKPPRDRKKKRGVQNPIPRHF